MDSRIVEERAFQELTIPNERVATQKVHNWTAIESAIGYVD